MSLAINLIHQTRQARWGLEEEKGAAAQFLRYRDAANEPRPFLPSLFAQPPPKMRVSENPTQSLARALTNANIRHFSGRWACSN